KWVLKALKKERKKRRLPLEAKKIGNNYYLYKSTSKWDKQNKKTKKVSLYLGKMSEKGVTERVRGTRRLRTIYEYGNARLALEVSASMLPSLKRFFPFSWQELLATSIVRLLQQTPLRLVKSRWEKLYLSKEIDANLSPNTLSDKLRLVGSDWESQKNFFESLMRDSKFLVFDLSSLFSESEKLPLAEKGHNADHLYLKQVNFALFFAQDARKPVMLKPLPGSVWDIKCLKNVLDEFSIPSCVLVFDRGFASCPLSELLSEKRVKFIMPLRRNFEIIDYEMQLPNSFVYRNRGINWGKKPVGKQTLYVFEDVKLKAEEETNFISLIGEGKRKQSKLAAERKKFGKISILTNVNWKSGKRIYSAYKEREEVEQAFDALKNELENDKTYLGDADAVRGYFFISFLSLYLYYEIGLA
ncbi:transposase, partial [Candidatus Micrarchaeota archaeon]|nr:transposase [Candidatus Micrarchaeota archaeon]